MKSVITGIIFSNSRLAANKGPNMSSFAPCPYNKGPRNNNEILLEADLRLMNFKWKKSIQRLSGL